MGGDVSNFRIFTFLAAMRFSFRYLPSRAKLARFRLALARVVGGELGVGVSLVAYSTQAKSVEALGMIHCAAIAAALGQPPAAIIGAIAT